LGGELLGGSPNGGSIKRGLPDSEPPKGLPLDPPIRFYGWSTFDLRIFMPPWYQPVLILSETTNKLPY